MPVRSKVQVALTMVLAFLALGWAARFGSPRGWLPFLLLLAATLLSAGLLVKLPKSDGSMSVNFPFILMGLMVLSPVQAFLLAGLSVVAQSLVQVRTLFAAVQVLFNITNAILAAVCAYGTYAMAHRHMAPAPALTLASITYFVWNTGTFAALIAPTKGERTHTLWLAEFPWYLPFYLMGATLAALTTWLAERFGWSTAVMLIPAVYTLYRTYMGQLARLREREHHLQETEALHMRIIEGLAMAIEAKDQQTHDHLFRVRNYVESVGKMLGLSAPDLQALQIAAFLHDIGKLAVPEHIINKPGKLTPEEFETMKIHPSVGAEILERVRFPYPVVPMVRSHHEWWNGAGYPDGLKGDAIPLGARILTVVDCFDALASDRPYRKGMPELQALDMIKTLAGRQFDPAVVEAFMECHAAAALAIPEPRSEQGFMPLNTEPEVWRGFAPGAGFETGSDENAPALGKLGLAQRALDDAVDQEVAALVQSAEAREAAHNFFEMSQASAARLSPNDSLRILSARVQAFVPHEAAALYVQDGNHLRVGSVVGEAAQRFSAAKIHIGEGISGWVAQRAEPLLNGNVAAEPGCPAMPDGTPVFHSALALPMLDPEGRLFAVLTLYAHASDSFQKRHLRLLQAMASKMSLALGNALQWQRERPQADAEGLLGVPSLRRLYLQLDSELERCRRSGSSVVVSSCVFPTLGDVQARQGQLAGNRLMGKIFEEFHRILSPGDFVARQGGDEFTFVIPAADVVSAEHRRERLTKDISAAVQRVSPGFSETVSVGSSYFPIDGETAEALLAVATRRMHAEGRQWRSQAFPRPNVRAQVTAISV